VILVLHLYHNNTQNNNTKLNNNSAMDITERLKQRDFKTSSRIEIAERQSKILRVFFDKGFKSFDALSAIVLNYNPELSEKRLYDFWHFRIVDDEFCQILNDVFEKLKSE